MINATSTRNVITNAAIVAALLAGLFQPPAQAAETSTTPKRGSDDRTQILELMRKPMEQVFGKPIEFEVDTMSFAGPYGFARLHPQRPGGTPLDIDFPCEVEGRDIVIEATFIKRVGQWSFDSPADGQPGFCADDVTSWDDWLKARKLPPAFIGREHYLSDIN